MEEEWLMMGLRIREGISLASWKETFGQDLTERYNVTHYLTAGLLELSASHLSPTKKGLSVAGGIARGILGG